MINNKRRWAEKVLAEFFAQGDKERAAGQPISPMCDRHTTSRGASQVNFIEFVVAPLFSMVVKIFPDAGELMENLHQNRLMWQDVLVAELSTAPAEKTPDKQAEITKANTRLQTFSTKYNDVFTIAAKRKRDHYRRYSSVVEVSMRSSAGSIAIARSTGQSQQGGRPSFAGSDSGASTASAPATGFMGRRLSGMRRLSGSILPGLPTSNTGNNLNNASGGGVINPTSPTAAGGGVKGRGRSASGRMSFTVVNRILPMDGERVTEEDSVADSDVSSPV